MMVIEPEEAGEHIRAGNMRVLAQVSETRLPRFPDVPTLREAGFDVRWCRRCAASSRRPESQGKRRVLGGLLPSPVPHRAWRKYLEDNQFEDGFQTAAEVASFYDDSRPRCAKS